MNWRIHRFGMRYKVSIFSDKTSEIALRKHLMLPSSWRRYWHFAIGMALGIASGIVMPSDLSLAQSIILDGTLGPAGTLTGPRYIIPQEVGQTVDTNLFHSFFQFGLLAGERVGFASTANIRNILVRVTGGSPSFIDGRIFTQSLNVNLFLINPSGIQFGANARLEVGGPNRGSFVATTADTLVWPNGGQFSATNPGGANSLLTLVGDPGGFLYQLKQPAPIVSSGNVLDVYRGQSLLLLGGNVRLDDSALRGLGGRIELGGLSAPGTVRLNADGNNLSLIFPDNVVRADIFLTNRSLVGLFEGRGGTIAVNSRNLTLSGQSLLYAGFPRGFGTVDAKGDNIQINATGTVTLDGAGSTNSPSAIINAVKETGTPGGINIQARSLFLSDGAYISSSTSGQGNAGNIQIDVSDSVSLKGGSVIQSISTGQGNVGNVTITAGGEVALDGIGKDGIVSYISTSVGPTQIPGFTGERKGGDITIQARSLTLTNGARLDSTLQGRGNAGNVKIKVSETVTFDGQANNGFSSGVDSRVAPEVEGNGGDIEISTGSLFITNGGSLSASTSGQGDAGRITINARDTVLFDGVGNNGTSSEVRSTVESKGKGNSGGIDITTGSLFVTNGAILAASTFGEGNAGSVTIRASDTVRFDGVGSNGLSSSAFSTVEPTGIGKGGGIDITTGSLFVTNGGQLNATTTGQGAAGNVSIRARDTVRFDGVGSNGLNSGAFSVMASPEKGEGGDIDITTGSLFVTDGAILAASTVGQGDAGNVTIRARDTVLFDGVGSDGLSSGVFSSVGSTGIGNGGDIDISTNLLFVTNRAVVNASTYGQGNAGTVRINAGDTVSIERGSRVGSFVEENAVGDGGEIHITTGSLFVTDRALVDASSSSFERGNAGKITINARDTVSLERGSGVASLVGEKAVGDGGDIVINTSSLSLTTDAFISSTSLGTGIAGDITIQTTQNLELDRSIIASSTQSGNGGNMTLQVGDILLMRNGSNISTSAGEAGAGGNGGNIDINADFLVAVPKENSDITANAYEGNGGNINITTQGIFGLEFRENLTPLSDITASSELGVDGEFQLDLLTNVDPARGLAELPGNVVDASQQIDRRCTPADQTARDSSFTITGRGGLPPSPNDPLQSESVVTNWVTLDSDVENKTPVIPTTPKSSAPRQLVEAQGWHFNEKGQVVLTASAPKVTPHEEWLGEANCNTLVE